MDLRCRECGSERIARGVRLAPQAGPKTLLGRLRARVCADCGSSELFADDPMDLYLAHAREAGGEAAVAPGASRPPAPGAPAANIQCPSCGSVIPAAETRCEVCGWAPGTTA